MVLSSLQSKRLKVIFETVIFSYLNALSPTPRHPRRLNFRKKPPHRFEIFSTTRPYKETVKQKDGLCYSFDKNTYFFFKMIYKQKRLVRSFFLWKFQLLLRKSFWLILLLNTSSLYPSLVQLGQPALEDRCHPVLAELWSSICTHVAHLG